MPFQLWALRRAGLQLLISAHCLQHQNAASETSWTSKLLGSLSMFFNNYLLERLTVLNGCISKWPHQMFPRRCKQPQVWGACRASMRRTQATLPGARADTHTRGSPLAQKIALWNMFLSGFSVILQNPGFSSSEKLILLLVRSFPKVIRWAFTNAILSIPSRFLLLSPPATWTSWA